MLSERLRSAVAGGRAGSAGSSGGPDINIGTRGRLRLESCSESRPHLLLHARQRDVGTVVESSRQSPAMAKLYTIVHFENCGHDHRLLDAELEYADD